MKVDGSFVVKVEIGDSGFHKSQIIDGACKIAAFGMPRNAGTPEKVTLDMVLVAALIDPFSDFGQVVSKVF